MASEVLELLLDEDDQIVEVKRSLFSFAFLFCGRFVKIRGLALT